MSTVPESTLQFNAEVATNLTADFLKRLGYKRGLRAIKVTLAGELYVVEMGVELKTAKVQIDPKTKEVKEYEIQEGEEQSESSFLKNKMLFLLIGVVAVAAVGLKLIGLF
jgi:hypothetical protein